jgi:hypothetical protein
LTRPAAGATPHPSSGPGDRNGASRPTQQAPGFAIAFGGAESSGRIVDLPAVTIDAIARRVVELLDDQLAGAKEPAALIDVGELARRTGISRTWIYTHALDLGAIRLGSGPKARLRFNPDTVERLLTAGHPQAVKTAAATARRRRTPSPPDVELLPIGHPRTGMSRLGLLRRRGH